MISGIAQGHDLLANKFVGWVTFVNMYFKQALLHICSICSFNLRHVCKNLMTCTVNVKSHEVTVQPNASLPYLHGSVHKKAIYTDLLFFIGSPQGALSRVPLHNAGFLMKSEQDSTILEGSGE